MKNQKNPHVRLLKGMIEAAHESGRIILKYHKARDRLLRVKEKPDAGLVTQVDLESELACKKILSKLEPKFDFIAEETAAKVVQSTAPGRFIIDPLDGTTNFIHGYPMFCVTIGAELDGQIQAGVIYHPILKDTYTCIRGKGAFLNGHKIQVSKTAKVRDSLLSTGFTYRKQSYLKSEMDSFHSLSKIARAIRRPGSAALDLAYVARGVFDGFWERNLSPWDVAAGSLLIEEAGGKVTQFDGKKFDVFKPTILASNGNLHKQLMKQL